MITYPYTEDGVRSALEALGRTSFDVAANLAALGYQGTRADCDDCPLVHYLIACFPNCHTIRVGDTGAHLFRGFDVDSLDFTEPLTPATAAFVTRFDDTNLMAFPELDRSYLIEGATS